MSAPETVSLTALTREVAPTGSVSERGTFIQRAGVNLFYSILLLTALILLGLFLYLLLKTPALSISPSSEIQAATVQVITQERQIVFANFLSGIEKIIIAFCLPIITAILGYLFGTRADRDSSSE